MPKSLDILIGLSLVMLLMSMIVTVATQFVTTVLNSRGKHLLRGVAELLRQIDPQLQPAIAREIAAGVLLHPLIRNANGRLGSVIHREELTALLLELASNTGPRQLQANAREALQRALVAAGACKQGSTAEIDEQLRTTVANIDSFALQLELNNPELTNNARARIAILRVASSGLIAKINFWFDQTIDRVSDRFTGHARVVTFFASLLLALSIQLDTAALVSRLSSDDAVRNTLIAQAQVLREKHGSGAQLTEGDLPNLHDLVTNNVIGVPVSWSDWRSRWSSDNAVMRALGILLSSVLLSLGAPFWYNTLQSLLRLRSLTAEKDDEQRRERQLAIPAATAVAAPVLAAEDRALPKMRAAVRRWPESSKPD